MMTVPAHHPDTIAHRLFCPMDNCPSGMTTEHPPTKEHQMDTTQAWTFVPGIPQSQGMALLAMAHLEYLADQSLAGPDQAKDFHIEVEAVANLTGMAPSSARSVMRGLSEEGLVRAVYYLEGEPIPQRRVGYRIVDAADLPTPKPKLKAEPRAKASPKGRTKKPAGGSD